MASGHSYIKTYIHIGNHWKDESIGFGEVRLTYFDNYASIDSCFINIIFFKVNDNKVDFFTWALGPVLYGIPTMFLVLA